MFRTLGVAYYSGTYPALAEPLNNEWVFEIFEFSLFSVLILNVDPIKKNKGWLKGGLGWPGVA